MLRYLLHRPIGVSMSLIAVVLAGLLAFLRMPTGLMPEAEVPRLQVEVSVPSASPAYLEQSILQPLRVAFQGLYGLSAIESIAGMGTAQVTLTVGYDTDMQLAYLQTQEKIDQQLSFLPEMGRPLVRRVLQTDIPIVRLQVTSDKLSLLALSETTTAVIKRRLEQIEGVGLVAMNGEVQPMMRLTTDPDKMRALQISNQSIIRTVQAANFQLSQLKVKEGNYEYDLTFDPLLSDASRVGQLLLMDEASGTIRLEEVVAIASTYQETSGKHVVEGKEAVVLAIHKQHDADQQEVDYAVQEAVASLRLELTDLELKLSQNQTALLQVSLRQLASTLLLGCLLAGVILALFSAHWKPPLMMLLLIPVAMVMAVGLLYLLGLTINIISLSGMILGVGILIDNGIIMIDNIQSKRRELSLLEACVIGANEIMPALISSTLTTLAVFLPLMVLDGVAGTLFKEQVITLGVVLFSSLLAAYFLLPLLYLTLRPSAVDDNRWLLLLQKGYQWTQLRLGTFFWVMIFVLFLGGGVLGYLYTPQTQLPPLETPDARLDITWALPLSLEQHHDFFSSLMSEQPDISFWEADLGRNTIYEPGINDLSHALLYVQFDSYERKQEILPFLTQQIRAKDSLASVKITRAKNPYDQLFDNEQVLLRAKLRNKGKDIHLADTLINGPFKKWKKEEGFLTTQGFQLELNTDRMERLGITPSAVFGEVRQVLADQQVTTVYTTSEHTPIYFRSQEVQDMHELSLIKLSINDSSYVSLGSLMTLQPTTVLRYLTHDEAGRYQSLRIEEESSSISQEIEVIREMARDKGWMIQWDGSYIQRRASLQYMLLAFGLAVILLYVILAAQFESMRLPMIILAEIPISLSGAFIALWIVGDSINLSSLMGMVIMLGIIINDSILKVDTIRRYQLMGVAKQQAIHTAGQERLKPILMTSLTTVLALVPVLFGAGMGADLQAPLAVSVIGGLMVGTVCSIYLIPILYRRLV